MLMENKGVEEMEEAVVKFNRQKQFDTVATAPGARQLHLHSDVSTSCQ